MMSEEAFVLWLDMLGYKNWLNENTNLSQAEKTLLEAIELAYTNLKNQPLKLGEFEIRCHLISDTFIFWSHDLQVNTLIAFCVIYHVLNTQLAKIGLPLRGALVKGSIRIRDDEPKTLLGTAIVKCASLEPTLNAFVVAVDESIIDFLQSSIAEDKQWQLFLPMLDNKRISTKRGDIELYVLKWWIPLMSFSFAQAFKLFDEKLKGGHSNSHEALILFCRKLINSEIMVDTIQRDEELYPIAHQAWSEALSSAKEFLRRND